MVPILILPQVAKAINVCIRLYFLNAEGTVYNLPFFFFFFEGVNHPVEGTCPL